MANWRPDEAYQGVLEAAIRLFHERGYANVPLREVAVAAGVPTSTLSTHFPTRRALLHAVARRMRGVRTARLDELECGFAEPYERLHALIVSLGQDAREDGALGCASARLLAHLDVEERFSDRPTFELVRDDVLFVEAFVSRELAGAGLPVPLARETAARFVMLWQGAASYAVLGEDVDCVERELDDWLDHWSNVI